MPLDTLPESQSRAPGLPIALPQEPVHSVVVCVADAELKSHVTVSPAAISVVQSPLLNDESQNQLLPTTMGKVAALTGVEL